MKSKDKLIKAVSTYANRKGISVDAAVSELNKMGKDEINNIFDNMKLFKDGGKLDYLLCLKKGGSIKDCGCGGEVKKGQDGLVTEIEPTPVKSKFLAQIMRNLNMIPTTKVGNYDHTAVVFPDGRVQQTASGNGDLYTLNISPQQDSTVTVNHPVDGVRKWSNTGNTFGYKSISREKAVAPFQSVKVKK